MSSSQKRLYFRFQDDNRNKFTYQVSKSDINIQVPAILEVVKIKTKNGQERVIMFSKYVKMNSRQFFLRYFGELKNGNKKMAVIKKTC